MKHLPVKELTLHPSIQSRVKLTLSLIKEYAALMKDGIEFPPIEAVSDGEFIYVWDGFHRVKAAEKARIENLEAQIILGTLKDAQWLACGANVSHGQRRTNADKHRAVEMALLVGAEKSNREIARHCGVGEKTVRRIRAELEATAALPQSDNRTGADGRTINTSNIGKRSTFNKTNENIEWAAWSWNPVTGCKHGCEYCYARDIANRFYEEGFEPTYRPERLAAPTNTKPMQPRWEGDRGYNGVFVCSMADLFGDWVEQEWIDSIMDVVRNTPQWTYIFLTKNPRGMIDIDWPENTWVGTTVDTQARVSNAEDSFENIDATVKFVSCEPLQEDITFTSLVMFDWIIIGGASKTTKTPKFHPPREWVVNLERQAREYGCKIYEKTNLLERIREYPCQ